MKEPPFHEIRCEPRFGPRQVRADQPLHPDPARRGSFGLRPGARSLPIVRGHDEQAPRIGIESQRERRVFGQVEIGLKCQASHGHEPGHLFLVGDQDLHGVLPRPTADYA